MTIRALRKLGIYKAKFQEIKSLQASSYARDAVESTVDTMEVINEMPILDKKNTALDDIRVLSSTINLPDITIYDYRTDGVGIFDCSLDSIPTMSNTVNDNEMLDFDNDQLHKSISQLSDRLNVNTPLNRSNQVINYNERS